MTDLPHYLLHPEGDRWELDQAAKVWGFLRFGVPPLDLQDLSVTHRRLRQQARAELLPLAETEEIEPPRRVIRRRPSAWL